MRATDVSTSRAGATRVLDGAAVALALGAVAILATGGGRIAGADLIRAEDFVVALAVVTGVRWLLRPPAPPPSSPAVAVAAGVVLYVVIMGFIVVTRHHALRTHAFDLGYYVQVVWNLAQGNGAVTTHAPTYVATEAMHAWGDHLSPVLYVLVPLMWLAPGAPALLLAQTAILAAGAFALFAYARPRVGPGAAAGSAALYLMNPSIHGINLRDVHPQAFAIPLVMAAALAFDRGRHVLCAAALVLVLACREDAAVAVVGFGIWLALARGCRAAGAAVAGAAVVVLFVDVSWIMPSYLGARYNHLIRYPHLGHSLGEILVSLGLRPHRWLAVALTGDKLLYLVAMLAPLGFLPLLGPRALLAALPGLALNLLSVDERLFNYRSQYQAFVLPFLLLAAVDGGVRLRAIADTRRRTVRLAGVVAAGFLAAVVLTSRTVNDLGVRAWRLGADQRAAHALIARIPPAAAVTANERLVPHLALRSRVFPFPRGLAESEYVVELARVAPQVPATRYEMVAGEGRWMLWRRRASHRVNPAAS
jgi:uncharacterized membrane protein